MSSASSTLYTAKLSCCSEAVHPWKRDFLQEEKLKRNLKTKFQDAANLDKAKHVKSKLKRTIIVN